MSDWLDVATPYGDLVQIRSAARSLGQDAGTIQQDQLHLVQVGKAILAEWVGEAAEQFRIQHLDAVRAVAAISEAHADAASLLTSYADQWDTTKQTSDHAHGSIGEALESYGWDARSALDNVAAHIEDFLNHPLVVLGPIEDAARHILERLRAWTGPHHLPSVFTVTDPFFPVPSVHTVLGALQAGVSWGISHLLDGIHHVVEAIANLVGGAIHAAVEMVHQVEHAFAVAVAAAQKAVHDAIHVLYELGKKVAGVLVKVAVEAAKIAFTVAGAMVRAAVVGAMWAGKAWWEFQKFTTRLEVGLAALALILARRASGHAQGRRVSESEADRLDGRAQRRIYEEGRYQDQVQDRLDLAQSSYDDSGEPTGWTRIDSFPRPGEDHDTGLYVAVYRNEVTHEIVAAFRGSQGENFDIRDWSQDGVNALDLPTEQGIEAIAVAKQIAGQYADSGYEVSFTGHSLGGALASMASIATGVPATTFNAAGIGDSNYVIAIASGGGVGASESQIVNFHTWNDGLTIAQDAAGVRPAAGAQVEVASNATNVIAGHNLSAFRLPHFLSDQVEPV